MSQYGDSTKTSSMIIPAMLEITLTKSKKLSEFFYSFDMLIIHKHRKIVPVASNPVVMLGEYTTCFFKHTSEK